MPPHTRSQRKRQASRQQARQPAPSAASLEAVSSTPSIGETVPLEPPPRAVRTNRRVLARPAPEPVDYTEDYAAARTDLRWIAIWAGLLFVAMIALYFSHLV